MISDDFEFETVRQEIRCPECRTVQSAEIELTQPFATYIHECSICGYLIMESEWETVEEPPKIEIKEKQTILFLLTLILTIILLTAKVEGYNMPLLALLSPMIFFVILSEVFDRFK